MTLYIIWKDPTTLANYKIGELSFDGTSYMFRYDLNGVEQARQRGFTLLPAFPDVERLYQSKELFQTFAHRLPHRARPDYQEILGHFKLSSNAHPIEMLQKTRGRLATDHLSFEESPEKTPAGAKTFECYVAGWQFYEGERMLDMLRPGSEVTLVREESNPFSSSAVEVYSSSGHKLGYIPSYHAELTTTALSQHRPVSAVIVEVKPPPTSSDERTKIRVST